MKILNNSGTTIVNVMVAFTILMIISAMFMKMLQTSINISNYENAADEVFSEAYGRAFENRRLNQGTDIEIQISGHFKSGNYNEKLPMIYKTAQFSRNGIKAIINYFDTDGE